MDGGFSGRTPAKPLHISCLTTANPKEPGLRIFGNFSYYGCEMLTKFVNQAIKSFSAGLPWMELDLSCKEAGG